MAAVTIRTSPAPGPAGALSATLEGVTSALSHGARVAVADTSAEVTLDIAKRLLGPSSDIVLATDTGRAVAKLIGASALAVAANAGLLQGRSGRVARQASTLVCEAVGRDLSQPLMEAVTAMIPALNALDDGAGE